MNANIIPIKFGTKNITNSNIYPNNTSNTAYKSNKSDTSDINKIHSTDSINKTNISETTSNFREIKSKKQDYKNMLAGFVSSAISRTICAPFDRLKMLYQVQYIGINSKPPSIINGFKNILNTEGVTGLFRGNFINLLKGSPETGIKLYSFEMFKWKAQCYYNKEKLSNSMMLITAALSGVISTIVVFPLEVVKLRIGGSKKSECIGIINTCKALYNEPRGIVNFYSGLEASILSSIPNAGILLYSYEKLKRIFSGSSSVNNASLLSTTQTIFIGGLSAFISSLVLYPFQMVQARMIMQNVKEKYSVLIEINSSNKILNKIGNLKLVRSFYTISKNEGFFGFYKGYAPALGKIVIGNALGFGVYEKTKKILRGQDSQYKD